MVTKYKVSAIAITDGKNEEASRQPWVSATAAGGNGNEDISREPQHRPTRQETLDKQTAMPQSCNIPEN